MLSLATDLLDRQLEIVETHQSYQKRLQPGMAKSLSKCKKQSSSRRVSLCTFKKWQTHYEIEYQTLSWLRCNLDLDSNDCVGSLWYELCRRYESSIVGSKNFQHAWLVVSVNQRTSSVIDHAMSEQHSIAVNKWRNDNARASQESISAYAPVAKSLLHIEKSERTRLLKKFDLCYILAKEVKYSVLAKLEKRHGVDIGTYLNKARAQEFTHYIAESQRLQLRRKLMGAKFYSAMIDGSTDAGNIDDELVMVQYCALDHDT